ncbi:nickel pincer cofactor biosynthesis protein LarC [Paenibacillus xerothermodurans]|uniref:Nickel pincer cofactor biosynthesis protein LarC n=1 Tax=Paenibacillus xerothermodurans TaxID=1977292 RepID=A0A2W1NU23_PAEXE|nr:nickel pincer cofactor biosynthesis protein LarC [Paenibacillus xerothermodurans]PZE21246.1 nickel pincer cofactor biosynthesis protein LarC [Paenibacillus xerothermodurans]
MKIAYLDCFSGISGDMTLAALVDAGADRDYIEEELHKIKIEPFSLEWKRANKNGISALKLDVMVDPNTPPTHHRHYSEIVKIIQEAGFKARVVKLSLAIFDKIAIAEAKIHNMPVEKVHFHEVGAIDSIVDVIGVALALDSLDVEKVFSSPVVLGAGTVRCDHGIYPVPAPATLEMMRGLPISPSRYAVEMTTPTGAGIIAGLVDEFAKGYPSMVVETVGYGAGTRDLPNQPNVLRVVIGKADSFNHKYQVHYEEVHIASGHEHSHEHHHSPAHHHSHTHAHGHGDDHHTHQSHTHEHSHDHSHEHGHNDGHEHEHRHTDHNKPGHGHSHVHPHSHGH